ncbi:MAG TPA: multicopper oxidase family protein [Candidatus Dormibacteraeota bacterium]|nr:multicopper oxidase family protein [Candidatus Dormibacteraeota bacterium]
MNRAAFLRRSAGAMAVASIAPLSERALASDVVEYALTAAALTFTPAPGIAFPALGYNGRVPGPLLRVVHGQRVRVLYRNLTGVATTVHWHGMILPNAMDGVPGVTQAPVLHGGSFRYEFAPGPPGTRWYHDHGMMLGAVRGLFGMFVVDDPKEQRADKEFALVFHDVPDMQSVHAAMAGRSSAPMTDPVGSPEMAEMMPNDRMGDEVSYRAHCINGESYPATQSLTVNVGERVRLRILNANPTQTRYVRLAAHRLTVTHADGNPLERPVDVDALRIGVAERYDAWFEVTRPGAWLLQGLSSDPLAFEQAVVVRTPGMENVSPQSSSQSLEGVDYFTYEKACGVGGDYRERPADVRKALTLGGGTYGTSIWSIDGKQWPNTPKIHVRRGDRVAVTFTNKTDMEHPMHLHGHVFSIVAINGKALLRPLAKDVSLVPANGGTLSWTFDATSPAGRWLLHCHNEVHMMDGMMTEVDYLS